MNKLRLLLFWCLLVGTLSSCGNEDDPQPDKEISTQDYAPTSAGSTWSYTGVIDYTLTSLGTTQNRNGKTYYEYETTQGSTTTKSFISKEAGVYTAIGVDPRVANMELTFLKENEPVGSSWEQTDVLNNVNTVSKFTIVGKNLTKTVEGKEYKDVINVKLESTYSAFGQEIPGITVNYFYAKGVGTIMADFGPQGTVNLKSYSIK